VRQPPVNAPVNPPINPTGATGTRTLVIGAPAGESGDSLPYFRYGSEYA
jgi:hypothetical protein